MQKLVRHQYKDQIWYEVEDAPRITRYRKDSKDHKEDTQGSTLQTNSLRGKDTRTTGILHKGKVSSTDG